jgi:hypothetical protein
MRYDFQVVVEASKKLETFRAIRTEVLLLGGSKSPAWLQTALDTLEKMLPNVTRVTFPGLDHGGSSDASATNRGGQPELVAQAMRRFFV